MDNMSGNYWMQVPETMNGPALVTFKNTFVAEKETFLDFKWSADERAQIFLDGEFIVDGPESGCPEYWYYKDFRRKIAAGEHCLVARVNVMPGDWNYSQLTIRYGFFCQERSNLLGQWLCRHEQGLEFIVPFPDWANVPRAKVSTDYGKGEWQPVKMAEDGRELHKPDLPDMLNVQVFPEEIRPGVLHFREYVCCRTEWRFQGRGTVRFRWTETPYLDETFDDLNLKGHKGNRDGNCFIGNADEVQVDGSLEWNDFQWKAGHYVIVETEGDVSWSAKFFRTNYPLPDFRSKDPLANMAFETLRACSHETFMDCPFYERLLYAGDSRLEALALYHISDDHRLAAKTLRMLLMSQREDGSIQSQYPSRATQFIPSYIPIFMLSFHDYWKLHPDDPLIAELLPRYRKLVDYVASHTTAEGCEMPGWQFLDWVDGWKNGVPKGNCAVNIFAALALRSAAELLKDGNLLDVAQRLLDTVKRRYYAPEKGGLYADDLEHSSFSEHTQALAILAGLPPSSLDAPGLFQCSIYFSYYYLSACEKLGRKDLQEKRLDVFRNLRKEGLTTLPEEFDNPRSDCHAWGAYVMLFI